MFEVKTEERTDNSTEKATWRFWSRLIGSLAILALVFLIVPGQMPAEIKSPAFNEANLNAVQEEGRKTLMEGRTRQAKGTVVTVVGGVPMYSYQGRKPTKDRPEWLDENNGPTLTVKDRERLAGRYEFPAPAWMRYGGRSITYDEHNGLVRGLPMFGFFGLAASIAMYYIFFWFFPRGRRAVRAPFGSFVWIALMTVLFGYLIPEYTVVTSLFWPLLFFSGPMVVMFLLWALTRSGQNDVSAEEPMEPGEATESVPG